MILRAVYLPSCSFLFVLFFSLFKKKCLLFYPEFALFFTVLAKHSPFPI